MHALTFRLCPVQYYSLLIKTFNIWIAVCICQDWYIWHNGGEIYCIWLLFHVVGKNNLVSLYNLDISEYENIVVNDNNSKQTHTYGNRKNRNHVQNNLTGL